MVLSILEESGPALANSAEGNLLIIDIRKSINDHKIGLGDISRQYQKAGGSNAIIDGKDFFAAIEEFEQNNPPVSDELRERISAISEGPESSSALAALEAAEEAYESGTVAAATFADYVNSLPMWEQIAVRGGQA